MTALHRMRLRTRLALGFGLVLALLLGVAALGLTRMTHIQERLEAITDVIEPQGAQAVAMRIAVNQVALSVRDLVLVEDDAHRRPLHEALKLSRARYDEAEQVLARAYLAGTQEEKALFSTIGELKNATRRLNDKALDLQAAGRKDEAVRVLIEEAKPVQSKWVHALGELAALEAGRGQQAAAQAKGAYAAACRLLLLLSAAAVVLGVAAAWLITRSVVLPLARAVGVAQAVAAGNLSQHIEVTTADETGQLLQALRGMNDGLKGVIGSVLAASTSVAASSTEIAQGNSDLSSRTEEQASALQQTAATMEELSSTMRSNAANAVQAGTLARGAVSVAGKGGAVIGQVIGTMQGIEDSARKIGEITGLIDAIAFQTNILALNAAVEAARAGEQGRGFAVVAAEVRTLAQRSAEAARQIKSLIANSAGQVGQGTALVHQAGRTMQEIVGAIEGVNAIVQEIGDAAGEQSAGVAQVVQAVTQMDQATQQNAALVEQSAAAADSLAQQAQQLLRAVGVFQLGAGARS